MYDFVSNNTCSLKFDVLINTNGTIFLSGDDVGAKKSVTFGGVASTITAAEAVNDDESSALHNGVAGFMWLFSGYDQNFDPRSVMKTTKEVIDNE